jgi:aquaporin Z
MRIVTVEPSAAVVTREKFTKVVVEAIGTFLLVFTVGAAIGSGSEFAPLAIGAALIVIYAGGRLSAGHYNPAVTLALLLRHRIGLPDAGAYWTTQIGAGLFAALLARAVIDRPQIAGVATTTLTGRILWAAFAAELIFTCMLCYVVLDGTTGKHRFENSLYGLAIGLTVVAGAAAMHVFAWPTLSVYLLTQVIAGVAAGVVFVTLNPYESST